MKTWIVEGAKKDTGEEISLRVKAEVPGEAAKLARQRGLLVSRVFERDASPDAGGNGDRKDAPQTEPDQLAQIAKSLDAIHRWVRFGGIVLAMLLIGAALAWIAAAMRAADLAIRQSM